MRSGKMYPDPLHYEHAWPSMAQFARVLALRYDSLRTRHSYYRQLRLLSEHFGGDPALLAEEQLRDYLLHVKTVRRWLPKSVRQAVAAARLFFCEQLGLPHWRLFDQVKAKDSGQPSTTQTSADDTTTTENSEPRTENRLPKCPCCQQPMQLIARILPGWKRSALWQPQQSRAPPSEKAAPQP